MNRGGLLVSLSVALALWGVIWLFGILVGVVVMNVSEDEKTLADLAREQRELVWATEVVTAMIEKIHQQAAQIRERDQEIQVLTAEIAALKTWR